MTLDAPLTMGQHILQVCVFLFSAIALLGGTLQMVLGQPDTTARLDNVHRFMAGIYLTMGFICFWAAWTIRQQDTLIYFIALGGFIGGCGRLLSMAKVGLPQPAALWLGYLVPELLVPLVMVWAKLSGI